MDSTREGGEPRFVVLSSSFTQPIRSSILWEARINITEKILSNEKNSNISGRLNSDYHFAKLLNKTYIKMLNKLSYKMTPMR